MLLDVIRTLYDYNAWANRQVFATAAGVDPEWYFARLGGSFDSVHDTLVHLVGAQWLWLRRWLGESPPALPRPADFADLADLHRRWEEIEAETQAFLAGLDETALGRVLTYRDTRGLEHSFPLWQTMLHQVNHATQHRSEAAMMLTRLGRSPGELDLLRYLDRRS